MMLRSVSILLVNLVVVVIGQRDGLFDNDLYQNVLDPELCKEQLEHMNSFEFYDASFRVPQGMLTGSFSSLGEYNQCLRINQASEVGPIQGKYCMIGLSGQESINVPLITRRSWPKIADFEEFNVAKTKEDLKKYLSVISRYIDVDRERNDGAVDTTYSLALCIPKACSVDDVLEPIMNNSLVSFNYNERYCRLPDDKPLAGADYAAIIILTILGFVTALSTGYDIYYTFFLKGDPKKRNKLYNCCSVYTNSKRLFTITATPGSLDCLDGVRSITTLWIILGHVYVNYIRAYASNLLEFFEWFGKRRAIWLSSADASVDTFLALSGLLIVYTTVNKMSQKRLLRSIHWFYLHRLLRMFPILAIAVLLQASVFFRVTDGPNWWFHADQVGNCRKYWWSALLHAQTYVNPREKCLPQTWYLSVDMQLHIASPLLLFWVLGSKRSAWSSLVVALVTVLTGTVIYCFLNDFVRNTQFYREYYYYNVLVRAAPFIVGMICGYILSIVRGRKLHIPTPYVAIGYLLALGGSFYALYQAYEDWDSSIVHDLNLSFEKSLWALSLCWVVFACVCGYGGPINWFLSLSIWKITARISYAMYMFHHSIMYMHSASLTTPFYYSMENIWFVFAAVTVYTAIVSIAACVLVEAPCMTLQKMLMDGLTKAPERKPKAENEDPDSINVQKQDSSVERG